MASPSGSFSNYTHFEKHSKSRDLPVKGEALIDVATLLLKGEALILVAIPMMSCNQKANP